MTSGCGVVEYVEHVEVWMNFNTTYRGGLQVRYKCIYYEFASILFVKQQ